MVLALLLIPNRSFGDRPPPDCSIYSCGIVQGPTGSISFTNVAVWPEAVICLGSYFGAWAETKSTCGDSIIQHSWSPQTDGCPPQYSTNTCQSWYNWPYFETNSWVLNFPGQSKSGSGLGMSFLATNCGSGSVTFYGVWRNRNPCTWEPMGGGTISVTKNFKVINLQITPGYTNALINRCQDPNRSVTFCLTNSCYPGGVAWSIFPVVTNGATITGSGGCATVKIGNVVQDYTITATSNDNTNCTVSAGLSVARDCICTNHTRKPDVIFPPFGSGNTSCGAIIIAGVPIGGCVPPWSGTLVTTPCGQTAQISCVNCNQVKSGCSSSATCFSFTVNGQDFGHCLYDQSSIVGGYFECICGSMIFDITSGSNGKGYWIESDQCNQLGSPHCFDSITNNRACSSGCYDY
jgi:hypothetical protein